MAVKHGQSEKLERKCWMQNRCGFHAESWKDRVKSKEALKMADTKRELYRATGRRQLLFFGRVMREKGLDQKIITGSMKAKNRKGKGKTNIFRHRMCYNGRIDIGLKYNVRLNWLV